ncbi:alpha-L-fucosidase-like isoform X2 [Belonocnema kinseyi]|nr:alpha-L-fucosidase-like isoform X2 [Belonocnema kinseyi]XP_033221425.1 alpha-L-fucosidase-like isoform X2 [Belonocnema kinseyi]
MFGEWLQILLILNAFLSCLIKADQETKYLETFEPTWESLDNRKLPLWYDEDKFGIFIHWGVFSVPSIGSEWFWKSWNRKTNTTVEFMKKNYPPNFTYQDFAKDFTAEFFNATQWSEIFKASGAKYVVFTSKHHEGYTMWPSKYSFSWNSVDVGPHRDIIGELSTAIRSQSNLRFGLYHSLFEWFNPLYMEDKANNFTTNTFVTNKVIPELHELVELYKPEVIWSDGEWEAPDTYWQSKEFLTWLFNSSPVKETVVVNDRWGSEALCHHGDFYTCQDRYNPGTFQPHKWENAMTIDRQSWGYRRNAELKDYMSLEELVKELVVTVSCNGNLLMNVGPTKEGTITPIFEERLRGMGDWLALNGEAIYKTKPWTVQNDTLSGDVWYTQSKDGQTLYAILLSWPKHNTLGLGSVKVQDSSKINLLGYPNALEWEQHSSELWINLPADAHKGKPGWVLVLNKFYN